MFRQGDRIKSIFSLKKLLNRDALKFQNRFNPKVRLVRQKWGKNGTIILPYKCKSKRISRLIKLQFLYRLIKI